MLSRFQSFSDFGIFTDFTSQASLMWKSESEMLQNILDFRFLDFQIKDAQHVPEGCIGYSPPSGIPKYVLSEDYMPNTVIGTS